MINLHLNITYLNVSVESVNKFYDYKLVQNLHRHTMTSSPSSDSIKKLFQPSKKHTDTALKSKGRIKLIVVFDD